jgi:hypothetical protein
MAIKAFVYTEVQNSLPFDQAPWRELNKTIQEQPGFINKTWLHGASNQSVGGFYAFDSIENAQNFVTGYFPEEVTAFNVGHTSRVFSADVVEEASREMNSMHFGGSIDVQPGAFVYTEVQLSVPFDDAPWRDLNPVLKQQPGFLSKTWLSGLNTNTPGGLYAFDTIENATSFAVNYFPTEARNLNAAFTTRVFDAGVVEEASRQLSSPFYS